VSAILSTDMTNHFGLTQDFKKHGLTVSAGPGRWGLSAVLGLALLAVGDGRAVCSSAVRPRGLGCARVKVARNSQVVCPA
jgi:hypothetical protein